MQDARLQGCKVWGDTREMDYFLCFLDTYSRDALQTDFSERIDECVDGLAMPNDGAIREQIQVFFVLFVCFVILSYLCTQGCENGLYLGKE